MVLREAAAVAEGKAEGAGTHADWAERRAAVLQNREKRKVTAKPVAVATATAVLKLVHLAGFARARARTLRSSDPRSADEHEVLFKRLQLATAACLQSAVFPQRAGGD